MNGKLNVSWLPVLKRIFSEPEKKNDTGEFTELLKDDSYESFWRQEEQEEETEE